MKVIIELILIIAYFVALRKIFVKAWKPGYRSLIPIYNFYEMSDIAWMSWLFKKAIWCGILWISMMFIWLFVYPIAYFPQVWFVLVCIFDIFMLIVNYKIARNFWWSEISSILYVIFNPIAILILAFWDDKYYLTEQKRKLKEISRKIQTDEFVSNKYEDDDILVEWESKEWNSDSEPEDPIKYIDPSDFIQS